VGGQETHAKLTIHQDVVKNAVEALRAEIAQQVYITGKCKFLVNSQFELDQ
jgi:hypothetical protein